MSDTLFVWDGILDVNDGRNSTYDVTWHGTLFDNKAANASKVKEPPRDAFKEYCDSDKKFNVTGTAQSVDGSKDDNKFKPFRVNLTGGDGWEMAGKKHSDAEHELWLGSILWRGSPDKRDSLAFGRGRDALGPFVSVGWVRPGNRITLARRHLAENDPRAKWSMDTLRGEIMKKIYDEDEEEIVMPPWQCDLMNSQVAL